MKVSTNNPVISAATLFILLVVLVSSCAPAKYLPTQQTIPLIKEKNELRATAAVSAPNPLAAALSNGKQYAVNTSLTYGITKELTVHANAMTTLDSEDNRKSISAGFGYQYALSPRTTLQTYLLGSRSKVTSDGEEFWWGGYGFNANISSISLQPQTTTVFSPKTSFTFSTGLKRNYYQNLNWEGETGGFGSTSSDLRVEPALSFSYSPSRFGFIFELGTSILAADSRAEGTLSPEYSTLTALFNTYGSIGITYCITCKN